MTHEHDPEDEQMKARLVRRPNGEDDGVTLYPLTQSVDDLKEAFPNAVSTDESGRAYLYLDEVHHLGNGESGRWLVEQMAHSLRSGPPTRRERARAQVLDAVRRTNLALTRDGEPLSQHEALAEYMSAADAILDALHGFGDVIDQTQGTDTPLPGSGKTLDPHLSERIDPYVSRHAEATTGEGGADSATTERLTRGEKRALAYEASAERLDAAGNPGGAQHARAMAVQIRVNQAGQARARRRRRGEPDAEQS